MKKSIIAIVLVGLLTGCSSGVSKTFFFQEKENVYDLYDDSGKELTTQNYDGYQKVGTDGYLVKKEDKYGYLLVDGKQKIELGKYQSLEVLGTMLIAKDVKEEKETITIFNSVGKELYKSSKDVVITIAGLPIIQEGKRYTVLNNDGTTFSSGEEKVVYADVYADTYVLVNYEDRVTISNITVDSVAVTAKLKGKYELAGYYTEKGYLIREKETNKVSLLNVKSQDVATVEQTFEKVMFDDNGNIIGENKGIQYLISDDGKKVIEITSYYVDAKNYVIKNKQFVYGPHTFYKDGKEAQVSDIQLDPLASTINHKLFPVYLKNKGYVYYTFEGKKAFDEVYQKAGVFDDNDRAIVNIDDGYYLIATDGKKSSQKYVHIELIDKGYYAGYTTTNKYEVIDKDGNKVINDIFMGTKDIITYGEYVYGVFNKNGKTFIYDMNDEYKVVFDVQGNVVFNEDGYFVVNDKTYYSIEGKKIYPR